MIGGIWLLVAQWIGPWVVEQAYAGRSLPLLNRLMEGRGTTPLSQYLTAWQQLARWGLLVAFGLWGWAALLVVMRTDTFFRRCVGPATPGTLGAIRMWVCMLLLVNVLGERLFTIAWLPPELRQPMGVMTLLHQLPIGLNQFVVSEAGLRVFQGATELFLILGLVGWGTRLVMPLAAICSMVLFGIIREYSFFWHQNLVATYVMFVLSCTPCGDGWSIDRLRRIARDREVPPADRATAGYGWSRYACWVALVLPYVAAGCSKFRNVGWFWWAPQNMRRILYSDTLNPVQFHWTLSLRLAEAPDALFGLLGFVGVWGEALFVLVLVSRLARRVMPILMAGMHMGIIFLQNIVFLDLILLQAIFFDFTSLRTRLGQWYARRWGVVHVLYDGWCPLCRRTVRVLGALDLFCRLELVDFRRLDLSAFNARHGTQVSAEALEHEMVIVRDGRAWAGFAGYRILALTLPVFWPLAPWLFVPGISQLGAAVYRAVARNRFQLLHCDTSCAREPEPERRPPAAVDAPMAPTTSRPRSVVPVAGLVAGLLFCWLLRVEYYPLTAMQMYTGKWWLTTNEIAFDKPFAQLESGQSSEALFRKAVGTLAINARYRPILQGCFQGSAKVARCTRFLQATGVGYNRTVPPGERVVRFVIEHWVCPVQDPAHPRLLDRFTVDVPPPQAQHAAASQDLASMPQ